ncbi:hypothetical protein ACVW1C_003322 [Bradyrhizobium sp. USDA 4011]
MRAGALISTIFLFLLPGPARAQAGIDTPASEARGPPESPKPKLLFHTTINPEPALLSRLQLLFASYFDLSVDLTAVLREIVIGSAVSRVPNAGQILYNPAHMLFLHFPEDWQRGGPIRVATLDAVRAILKKPKPQNALLAAYSQGFIEFAALAELMKEQGTRETLEIVWSTAPQSDADKQAMAYLLLRPIEQAIEVREQSLGCRQAINRFVDEVRAGKRSAIRTVPGLTASVKPTRFLRDNKQILLVLSDPLMARYHVIARFNVTAANCTVAWETSVFGM